MGFLVTFTRCEVCWPTFMQHTFLQKVTLTLLAAALVAGAYEVVYKGIIVGADRAINAGYKTPAAHATPTPKRRF